MVTTAPPPEMAVEKPQARPANESRAGTDGGRMRTTLAGNNGSAEPGSPARRGKRRRSTRGESPSSVQRFFLNKDGNSGIPELEREVENENTAMVEALKTDRTFIILSEWRPTVDNTTRGRPLIKKEAVSVSKDK